MRGLFSAAAALMLTVTSGCSFEHVSGTDDDTMVDTVMVDGELWEVHGYVHAEAWTPAFFYVFPLMPGQDAEEARQMAVAKARAMGAEEITDVRLHVETHMPLLWIAGWTEAHVSATAVSPMR